MQGERRKLCDGYVAAVAVAAILADQLINDGLACVDGRRQSARRQHVLKHHASALWCGEVGFSKEVKYDALTVHRTELSEHGLRCREGALHRRGSSVRVAIQIDGLAGIRGGVNEHATALLSRLIAHHSWRKVEENRVQKTLLCFCKTSNQQCQRCYWKRLKIKQEY